MTPTAFPLAWPVGVPRARSRDTARFSQRGDDGYSKQASMPTARDRLQGELDKLGRGVADSAILSTNVPLTLSGQPRGGVGEPADPGVAIYFTLKGKAIALPCDRWNRVADNIIALAKHIEAMRGMERWGVGSIEQAFAGYAALPAPEAKSHWTTVLGLEPDASRETISSTYRSLAKLAGNNETRLLALNMARDEALAARTLG